jgi:hypothetical protein
MRQSVVDLIRGAVVKRGVAAFVVVKADPFGYLLLSFSKLDITTARSRGR